jgi:hypothetical protein
MRRSIKSNQRKVKMLSFIVSADGTTVTGLDKNQITVTDTGTGVKTVELGSGMFGSSADYSVLVTTATADSVAQVSITDADTFVINTFDSTDGTTAKDAITHVLVIGSEVEERV